MKLPYTIGSVVPLGATYERANQSLIDPSNPFARIYLPVGLADPATSLTHIDVPLTTRLALAKWTGQWTVPPWALGGSYQVDYHGQYDGGPWASPMEGFLVVPEQGIIIPGTASSVFLLSPTAITTLARTKAALGIPQTNVQSDDRITALINDVSDAFETHCNRKFVYSRAVQQVTAEARQRMTVRRPPVSSVVSVMLGVNDDGSGGSADPVGNYQISDDGWTLFRSAGWPDGRFANAEPVFASPRLSSYFGATAGDSIQAYDPSPHAVRRNILVTYWGGYILPQYDGLAHSRFNPQGLTIANAYVTLPNGEVVEFGMPTRLEGAVWREVDRAMNLTGARGLRSQSSGIGYEATYGPADIDPDVIRVLNSFKSHCAG